MRYLMIAAVLALSACGPAEHFAIDEARGATSSVNSSNSTSVTSSVNSSNSTSITSSNTGGTSTTISSTVNATDSTCSTSHNGKRCEVSCVSPQVAQCLKNERATAPTCVCK